ncbi:hypothetical protein Btru_048283 [Bulinus truncatus]|nr:hypothetical protein Btru_048283 [Bulinus truncatus]
MCSVTKESDFQRILLVGKEGNGKKTISDTLRKTNKIISVVGSGVGDTVETGAADLKTVKCQIRDILTQSENLHGFNAIAFVLKYSARFTNQEKVAAEEVKSVFGKDVFRKHGIIIMTYGDLFDLDNEDDGHTFMDWCGKQTGHIRTLFYEVENRIVLFDNKTNDECKVDKQTTQLSDYVCRLNARYRLEEFEKANPEVKPRRSLVATSDIANRDRRYLRIILILLLIIFILLCVIVFLIVAIEERTFS